ncbi:MAG TPA: MBL fold metallo-hydrolase, partial [Bacillota bacterium]
MRIEITYIFHNSFIVRMGQEALLFDYPAAQFLDEVRRNIVRKLIQDTDLYVFASHNHPDHFNRDIDELGGCTSRVSYILARDIMR